MAYLNDLNDRDLAAEAGLMEGADIWDESAMVESTGPGHAGAAVGPRLPVRKPACQRAAQAAGAAGGLRIEAKLPGCRQAAGVAVPLEVQQIGLEVVRLAPETAAVPWGPRQMVHRARAAARSRRDASSEWGQARQLPMRWILGTGLGVVAVVLIALVFLPLINRSNAAGSFRPVEYVVAPVPTVERNEVMENLLGRQAEAERLLQVVATARTADELLPLVRDAGANEPLIRANPRWGTLTGMLPHHGQTRWNVADTDGRFFGVLETTATDARGVAAYWVLRGNQLLLDWKATVGFGTAGFDQLLNGQGDPTEIRGTIRPADFYTAVFPEEQFQCFRLVAPDRGDAIWTYAPRAEPAAAELYGYCLAGEILQRTLEARNVTVRLARGPAGSLPKQWKIVTMLHKEWIQP